MLQSGSGTTTQIGYVNRNNERCEGHRGVAGTTTMTRSRDPQSGVARAAIQTLLGRGEIGRHPNQVFRKCGSRNGRVHSDAGGVWVTRTLAQARLHSRLGERRPKLVAGARAVAVRGASMDNSQGCFCFNATPTP